MVCIVFIYGRNEKGRPHYDTRCHVDGMHRSFWWNENGLPLYDSRFHLLGFLYTPVISVASQCQNASSSAAVWKSSPGVIVMCSIPPRITSIFVSHGERKFLKGVRADSETEVWNKSAGGSSQPERGELGCPTTHNPCRDNNKGSFIMKAAALNSRGACFLEQGHLEEASSAFKEALKEIRDQMNRVPIDSVDVAPSNRIHDRRRVSTPQSWTSDRISSRGSLFLVYATPNQVCRDGVASNKSPNSLSASIMFNLSLTHHMKAMASPSHAAYNTALQLYEYTYRLLSRDGSSEYVLLLAVMNNVAHVQYKMRDRLAAERTCSLLWRAVLDIEEQDATISSTVDGFCTNVIQVFFKHSQAAAVA